MDESPPGSEKITQDSSVLDEEWIEQLRTQTTLVSSRNQRCDWRVYPIADLSGVNFNDCDLRNADFREANLDGASFSGADLSGADLSYASMRGAVFFKTKLTGAKFQQANLTGASLRSIEELSTKKRDRVVFDGAALSRAEFVDVIFDNASWINANLFGAKFSRLYGTSLGDYGETTAFLGGGNFTGADLSYAVMTGARLAGGIFAGVKFHNADLSKADMSGGDFSGAKFVRTSLREASAYAANFSSAVFSDVEFAGILATGSNFSGAFMRIEDLLEAGVDENGEVLTNFGVDGITLPNGQVTEGFVAGGD
jgi:uncharacterized protein YjbI with pentapeptide repeats